MKKKIFKTALLTSSMALALSSFGKGKIEAIQKEQTINDNQARKHQKTIEKIDDETASILQKYRQTLKKIENAKIYNEQLKKLITQQSEEKISIAEQIESLKNTNQGIVPLMLKMVSTLKKFVDLDVPFLPKEREKRVNDLIAMMDKADVSTSEKFRRILEAYQVENEYGKTIEAYRGSVKHDGNEITVDFLRIGRISFMYQSLDGSHSAIWDHSQKKWEQLDSDFKRSIKDGLAMARKQRAPSLLKMPIDTKLKRSL